MCYVAFELFSMEIKRVYPALLGRTRGQLFAFHFRLPFSNCKQLHDDISTGGQRPPMVRQRYLTGTSGAVILGSQR
jgi:hypothetical protein